MFADHLRSTIETAPRITLPAVAARLWCAFGEGHVSEAEAEALSSLIAARQVDPPKPADQSTHQDRAGSPKAGTGSRPRTDTSLERRRRWAASGRLPPALAARFTLAEQAVLALIAAETVRRKDCRLAIDNLSAVAGVSRSTVKNAIREAVRLGLITVEERRLARSRNDTNIVRIVSPEWIAWLRLTWKRKPEGEALAAQPSEGGGVKSATTMPTEVPDPGKTRPADLARGLPRDSGRPSVQRAIRNRRER